MKKKYRRSEFLKLSAFAGAGLLIQGCRSRAYENDISPAADSLLHAEPVKQVTVLDPAILINRGDSTYEMLRTGFNKTIQQYPKQIILCRDTKDIASAVHYAIEKKMTVNIKSGGHSFEGFSGNNNGLVIDLSRMNKVEWLNDTDILVQPGCRLSELYDAILPKKRILPAGSCGSVGIGGLTLGGGYGLFSRKYGLTCDNMTGLKIADGTGNIIDAKNSDEILWACRGAGNGNFGVVTEMIFTTKPAPETLQSYRFKAYDLNSERAKNILSEWFNLTSALPESCFSAYVLNGKTLTILITDFEDSTPFLQNIISSLKSITDKYIPGTKTELSKALKVFYGIQQPVYFKNASAGYYKDFGTIAGCIDAVLEKVITAGMIYQVNTLGGRIADPVYEAASCYVHRRFPYLSELQSYWDKPEQEKKYRTAFAEIQRIISQHNISEQYINYPALEFGNYKTSYYGDNYARLQKIKKQFDPLNIFRYPQGIEA